MEKTALQCIPRHAGKTHMPTQTGEPLSGWENHARQPPFPKVVWRECVWRPASRDRDTSQSPKHVRNGEENEAEAHILDDAVVLSQTTLGVYGKADVCVTEKLWVERAQQIAAKEWHGSRADVSGMPSKRSEESRPQQRTLKSLILAVTKSVQMYKGETLSKVRRQTNGTVISLDDPPFRWLASFKCFSFEKRCMHELKAPFGRQVGENVALQQRRVSWQLERRPVWRRDREEEGRGVKSFVR